MEYSNGFVNLKNPIIRNYLGLKAEFVVFLLNRDYKLYVDFDSCRAVVYGTEGNDIAHMTLKQLSRRVKV